MAKIKQEHGKTGKCGIPLCHGDKCKGAKNFEDEFNEDGYLPLSTNGQIIEKYFKTNISNNFDSLEVKEFMNEEKDVYMNTFQVKKSILQIKGKGSFEDVIEFYKRIRNDNNCLETNFGGHPAESFSYTDLDIGEDKIMRVYPPKGSNGDSSWREYRDINIEIQIRNKTAK